MTKPKDYRWVSDVEYKKAVGQFRMGLNPIMSCFHCYGLDVCVPGAIVEIVALAEQFGMRVRGKDIPISVRTKPSRRPTE